MSSSQVSSNPSGRSNDRRQQLVAAAQQVGPHPSPPISSSASAAEADAWAEEATCTSVHAHTHEGRYENEAAGLREDKVAEC